VRPRRLELTAFGPFPGTVQLEFGALDEAGIFGVHGPTGGGKTSLLDGIMFALYGDVPGARERDRLRSDHAPAGVETAVAFEFALRGEDWRVTRAPRQQRPKKRGSGTTTLSPTATLARRRGDVWEPAAEGVQEVGDAVRGLVGLDRAQFQQVVVLPQGEVEKALRASAQDRERLLSTLFDTGRFHAYTARLAQRADVLAGEVGRRAAALDECRRQALDRWESLAGPDAAGPVVEGQVDLEGLRDQAVLTAVETREAVARARRGAARAQRRLAAAELLSDRCRRRRAAADALEQVAAEAADVDALRERLASAQRAAPCGPALEAARTAADRLTAARRDRIAAAGPVVAAAGRLPVDAGAVGAAAGVLAAADPPGAGQVRAVGEGLRGLAGRIEGLLREGRTAAAAVATADAERAAATGHRAAAEALRDTARRLEEKIAGVEVDHRDAVVVGARVEALAAEAARRAAEADAAAAVPGLQAAADAALAAWRDATEARAWAVERHTDLLQARIDGMAAELAAQLAQGAACAVCGALDHPAPASCPSAVVDAAEIDEARVAAEAAAALADAAEVEREAALTALADARGRAGPGAEDPAGAVAAAAAAQAALAEAAAAAEGCPALAASLDELAAERDGTCAGAEELERLAGRADDAADRAAARAADAAEVVIAALGADVDVVDTARQVERLITLFAAFSDAGDAERSAAVTEESCARQLRAVLAGQGFAGPAEAEAASAPEHRQAEWRAHIAAHDRRRDTARATLTEPELVDLPDPPDLDGLRGDCEDADKVLESACSRLYVVDRAAADLGLLAQQHAAGLADLAPLRADAERVRRLADVCHGAGTARRMSLERYVLAAFLEEITDAATQRLLAMTDGRYSVRHSDERARHGAASGLSLVVGDAWTGVEREVGSLSGGETFQASLALALGIADVVQQHAGGVHLDMLFVDEGFGSLDADALDNAIVELERLREGGRLVGIISHVAALRERIPAGIRVTRTPCGSRAAVEVADLAA